MVTARIILVFAWLIGVLGITVSSVVWGRPFVHRIRLCVLTSILLGLAWLGIDRYTIRHRVVEIHPVLWADFPYFAAKLSEQIADAVYNRSAPLFKQVIDKLSTVKDSTKHSKEVATLPLADPPVNPRPGHPKRLSGWRPNGAQQTIFAPDWVDPKEPWVVMAQAFLRIRTMVFIQANRAESKDLPGVRTFCLNWVGDFRPAMNVEIRDVTGGFKFQQPFVSGININPQPGDHLLTHCFDSDYLTSKSLDLMFWIDSTDGRIVEELILNRLELNSSNYISLRITDTGTGEILAGCRSDFFKNLDKSWDIICSNPLGCDMGLSLRSVTPQRINRLIQSPSSN